jgi:chromosome segregation protein
LQSQQETIEKLNARNVERNKIELQIRSLRQEITRSETNTINASARQVEIKERKAQLVESNRKHQESIFQLSIKDGELTKSVRDCEKALQSYRQDVEKYRQAESKSRSLIDEINRIRRKLQDDQNKLEGRQARLVAQIDVLEQAEKSLVGVNQGTRQFLELVKTNKVRGSFLPLANSLEVKPGFERAIAAALGDIFDGLVIPDGDNSQEFLAQLETQDIGRIVFLVPGSQHGSRPDLTDIDILGSALDFIHPNESVLPMLKSILWNVYLVEDRQTANRLLGIMQPGHRMVTKAGEVFTPEGLIIAGKDSREKAIARPREKREYRETLNQIDQELSVMRDQLTEQDGLQENQRTELGNLERLSRDASRNQESAGRKLQATSMELERVQQQNRWGTEQIAQNVTQAIKLEEEMTHLGNELGVLQQSIEGQTNSVTELNRELNGLPVDDMEREHIHWRTSVAVIDRALNEKQTRLTELTTDIARSNSNLTHLAERSIDYQAQQQQVAQEKNRLTLEEEKFTDLINQLQELIRPLEIELRDKEEENTKQQMSMTVTQQATGVAERYVAQSQLELTRQREGMDSLRRRIEDDFGLVEFQYADDVTGQTPLPLGEMVQQLPVVKQISPEIEESINRQRSQLRRMGAINPEAQAEYHAVQERYQFMTTQVEDLKQADTDLRKIIAELDELMKKEFRTTFDAVAVQFKDLFTRLFGGGSARLVLTNEENPTETGIDIEARLPGRREQGLSLLSGGERSLTAVALIFALLKVSPTPFCVLDEVDAMLDESNVGRFCDLLAELGDITQFIVITHNRNTVQTAGVIYGITMGNDSSSQVISLKLDEVTEEMVG